jgi:DNA-binding transcriptional regulator/RsmH inhibitor MraZ
MANVLIGNYTARLDASGRIKIPEKFREVIEQNYGKDLFVTSLSDDSIKVYPLSVWLAMTDGSCSGSIATARATSSIPRAAS